MKKLKLDSYFFLCVLISGGLLLAGCASDNAKQPLQQSSRTESRGNFAVQVKVDNGKALTLYQRSYALLIGNSQYQDWGDLPQIPAELDQVEALLIQQGFTVIRHSNLAANQLRAAFRHFFNQYGVGEGSIDNRLLVYYSGHGETSQTDFGGKKGYIVPVDAPSKHSNAQRFHQLALNMDEIVAWSKNTNNRHMLFLFDSCFSGSILQAGRGARSTPEHIREKVKNPVRQFITAGSADEVVPAASRFTPAFIRAIKDGAAEGYPDGYITGTELAEYLAAEVPKYTNNQNHPREGKIGNGVDSEGDFIFVLQTAGNISPENEHQKQPEQDIIPPPPPLIKTGHLQVIVNVPVAEVNIKGTSYHVTHSKPLTLTRLAEGRLQITVSADGYITQQRTVTIQRRQWQQPEFDLLPTRIKPVGEITDRVANIKMRWIEPGCFQMGSPGGEAGRDSDEYQHRVCLSKGYYMGKYEVTQAQWQRLIGSNPSHFKCQQCPVEKVSWDDVQDFIAKLNRQSGLQYRLPTEAEWEYAARAGTTTAFSFGRNITPRQVNYEGNSPYNGAAKGEYRKKTVTVGSLPANAWGLHEMQGNVLEWVSDWYGDYYQQSPTNDPTGPSGGSRRVYRGGSWSGSASGARSAYRNCFSPDVRGNNLGFRLARTKN